MSWSCLLGLQRNHEGCPSPHIRDLRPSSPPACGEKRETGGPAAAMPAALPTDAAGGAGPGRHSLHAGMGFLGTRESARQGGHHHLHGRLCVLPRSQETGFLSLPPRWGSACTVLQHQPAAWPLTSFSLTFSGPGF